MKTTDDRASGAKLKRVACQIPYKLTERNDQTQANERHDADSQSYALTRGWGRARIYLFFYFFFIHFSFPFLDLLENQLFQARQIWSTNFCLIYITVSGFRVTNFIFSSQIKLVLEKDSFNYSLQFNSRESNIYLY